MKSISGVPRDAALVLGRLMSRVSDKPYFVYVLWSECGRRFYIGISDSPPHRLEQHNSALGSGWTTRYRPWTLVHTEPYPTYADARRRELELKRQKGGNGFFMKTGLDPSRFERGS
jgi:putative endonuclease